MKIIVPASSANLGPGFDSIGMAISLYLIVDVVGPACQWTVDHQLAGLPHDETNLIVKTACAVYPELQPLHLRVHSKIPVAHGLGSSSSAIVAGISLANHYGHLHLSATEMVERAAQIEGHPDNVAPAILGGLVVGTAVNDHFIAIKAPQLPYALVAYIPPYNLATAKARAVLPKQLPFAQATKASAIANTLTAALFARRYDAVGELMMADQFHEPYREALVPELRRIREIGQEHKALATYLSGAGSTVMTIIKQEDVAPFIAALRTAGLQAQIEVLKQDQQGARVTD